MICRMNKKNHFKPGMSKGAIATVALAGVLFTQSIAGSLPENLKETEPPSKSQAE